MTTAVAETALPGGPYELRSPDDAGSPVLRVLLERAARHPDGAPPEGWSDGCTLALGIEGGGLATSMCAGMAWALERLGLSPCFDSVYGVSSGGLIATYFASGRMDAAVELLPRTCSRDFVDLRRALRRRPVLSLDHLFELVDRHPFGDAVPAGPPDLRLLVAGVDDGRLHTLRDFESAGELRRALRACCAIPVISRETVTLRGHELADGGLIESVPFRTPLAQGATHVLALRSRDLGYRKGARGRLYGLAEDRVINRLPGQVPEMIRARPRRYDADADQLTSAQHGEGPLAGRVLPLAPPAGTPLVGRLETDAAKAQGAMRAGALVALEALSARRR
jgi:predicted patatin/cPLA2 family phospholipase